LSSKLILTSSHDRLSFGENAHLPIDIFVCHVLPDLSIRELRHLCHTHKAGFTLLKNAAVLNRLFSNPRIPRINQFQLAYAVGPSLSQLTQLKWKMPMYAWGFDSLMGRIELLWQNRKFSSFIQKCPNLVHLGLSGNRVTEANIQLLARNCPQLITLNLFQC